MSRPMGALGSEPTNAKGTLDGSRLTGAVHIDPYEETASATELDFAIGGGIDLRCSKRISIRLVQAD